ncbi:2-C-methyl-D-erythritol 4-phosphate cytidylyltransferase [Sporosarcina sp. P37]|uniref:2-C-methyl-D-erythritol 4-phosphate cytidylyltransferase n=1 Tax=unclassified Sporosarcina TaxID=2647733 RepID=UPI0009C101D6|nr:MULTISPECIES: 2-C-methyl-D-erythritol 4-phosphate cytidylyltransferase [unclassified Sporosarcina]ARD48173.1 2-C-methyl-D-erythritol 4-phosphate cytidylyltransferase [Sporosarcina sp. P33]ARK24689.1 2-C-methyl-D-erythritol 4-phosphate cytidylyltransferase [Sporosarcina sp. P37]PID19846.1 2-C-methyl-D-erythritol 4-phosphate cytidylyltransferase [Sporosarcina sp. P35]
MKYTVMIPAAGSGKRMGAGQNKLFLKIGEHPILYHTAGIFQEDPNCEEVIMAVKPEEQDTIQKILGQRKHAKPVTFVEGGGERQNSVAACIDAYKGNGIVLVHDAARPFLNSSVISELVRTASEKGAAIAAVKAKDTIKYAEDGTVRETLEREKLWLVQTPQAFRYELLKEASESAVRDGFLGTDESMLVERLGHSVQVVESSYDNVKMTTREDLAIGEILLARRK